MTEVEWLASNDPADMLEFVRNPAHAGIAGQPYTSERKLRLLACAVARAANQLLDPAASRLAIEAAEMHADGGLPGSVMHEWRRQARVEYGWTWCAAGLDIAVCLRQTMGNEYAGGPKRGVQAALLREIIGNPWRPVALPPGPRSWCRCWGIGTDGKPRRAFACPDCKGRDTPGPSPVLTPDVRRMAAVAYEERQADGTRDPARLAVLSDALEENGATGDILLHLRSPGSHVRGCHVVDIILGKS
jgi:hypothetical protein